MVIRSKLKIVDEISVGSPCPVESFESNAKALDNGWYCNQCSKEVYDLKKLSRKEIAKLIEKKQGHFCAVISRRTDGSLITKEPVSSAQSFLSAGIILASTTLATSQAIAQTEVGDIAPPSHQTENNNIRGEVYVSPPNQGHSSEASSEGSEQSNTTSETPVAHPPPDTRRTTGAVYIPEMRGKVKIDPK